MKLSNKILLISFFFISLIYSQDISGNYKLSGLSAVYYDFLRQESSVTITDNYGIGITAIGDTYEQGEAVQYDYESPTPEAFLNGAGVQLYVNFYTDGSAAIAQGSTYPTSTTENCISSLSTLPITGDQGYSSNLNSGATIPEIDIVGLPTKSIYSGESAGSCSITSSPVFDVFPQIPTEVTIPFPINTSSISQELGELIPANTILPGHTAGYVLSSNKLVSTIEQNTDIRPSLYLEWHAIDGPVNNSGLGDIIGEDEDGDGTDYDRIYGLETIRAMYNTNLTEFNCGTWNYPIAGRNVIGLQSIKVQQCLSETLDSDCVTYAENWIDNCIDKNQTTATGNDVGNLYAFDSNASSSLWGGIVTWNSINGIAIDDSDIDFIESCLDDGDNSDCTGRLSFSYSPQCLPSFTVRHFMVELTELCEESEQDVCGVCGGDGPVTWYNDADRDGLGNPDNYKTNCLPGYCIQDESLSYTDCGDAGNTWDWLSMGICSDETGTVYENLNPSMGDFEFCNYIMDNTVPGYENASWAWDRAFSTNSLDSDDTCINIDMYHNCDGSCINDADGDNLCDETDEYPNCASNIVDCNGDCDGTVKDFGCGCGEVAASEYYNCDNLCINDSDEDTICDELEISGCTNTDAQNYNGDATNDDGSCEYLSININQIPENFEIQSVYPNPFNPLVTITYGVPTSQNIEGHIYNLSGKLVSTMVSQYQPAGNYSLKWNATGKPSGIYIFILKTESKVKSQKLVLLK